MKPLLLNSEVITDPFESKDMSSEGIPGTFEISFISRLSGESASVKFSPSSINLKALAAHLKDVDFTIDDVEGYSCEYAKEQLIKCKGRIKEYLDDIVLVSRFENSGFYIMPTSEAAKHFLSHITFGESS